MIRVVCLVCVLACPVVAVEPTVAISFTNDVMACLLYTSPSPRDGLLARMPSSA